MTTTCAMARRSLFGSAWPDDGPEEMSMRFALLRSLVPSVATVGLTVGLVACGDEAQPQVKKLDPAAQTTVAAAPAPSIAPPAAVVEQAKGTATPDARPAAQVVESEPAAASKPDETKPGDTKPDEPTFVLPATFDARMQLGKKLAKKGETDDALAAFAGAAALDPKSEKPQIEMARVLIAAGDMKTARQHADQAIALAPSSSGAWNTKGRICFAEKEYDPAVYAFSKATQANGDNAFAWNNLGLALIEQERWDAAIVALETATGLPRPEPYMFANLGLAYERAGRTTEARTAYKVGSSRGSAESRKALLRMEEMNALAPTSDKSE